MSKKKILSLCLVIALAATAILGGTLAYFTDYDQNTNEFTVGNVAIDLYETVKQTDGADNVLMEEQTLGKGDKTNPEVKYVPVMPGAEMTKIATVENTGANEAYIALVIKNEGYLKFNQNVDDYYEKMAAEELEKLGLTGTVNEYMQKITNDVWAGSGWSLQYTKDTSNGAADVRYKMVGSTGTPVGDVEVLGYGYANSTWDQSANVKSWNYVGDIFESELNNHGPDMDGNFDSLEEDHTRLWVIYLKVPANASYTVDLSTICPAYFDNNSVQAFAGMKLDIKAFAIQTAGFATEEAAFAELFKADDCFAF